MTKRRRITANQVEALHRMAFFSDVQTAVLRALHEAISKSDHKYIWKISGNLVVLENKTTGNGFQFSEEPHAGRLWVELRIGNLAFLLTRDGTVTQNSENRRDLWWTYTNEEAYPTPADLITKIAPVISNCAVAHLEERAGAFPGCQTCPNQLHCLAAKETT